MVRQPIQFKVSRAEFMKLHRTAERGGVSLTNLMRLALGLPERVAGRATVESLEHEEDEAWEILRDLGEDPARFFPDNDDWIEAYPHEAPSPGRPRREIPPLDLPDLRRRQAEAAASDELCATCKAEIWPNWCRQCHVEFSDGHDGACKEWTIHQVHRRY